MAPHPDLACPRFDVYVITDLDRTFAHCLGCRQRIDTTKDRLDTSEELLDGEGLGQVVIRAALETHDYVEVARSGCQHQDRHVSFECTQTTTHLHAIDAR